MKWKRNGANWELSQVWLQAIKVGTREESLSIALIYEQWLKKYLIVTKVKSIPMQISIPYLYIPSFNYPSRSED